MSLGCHGVRTASAASAGRPAGRPNPVGLQLILAGVSSRWPVTLASCAVTGSRVTRCWVAGDRVTGDRVAGDRVTGDWGAGSLGVGLRHR